MKSFYFSNKDRKLGYGDGRRIVVGESHSVDGKPKACNHGLHASVKVIDALTYAPGSILYLVDVSGDLDQSDDTISGKKRTYLAEFDATQILRTFAK